MIKTENFVLRQIADEKILVPCGYMTEELARTITLSDTAAYIYEWLPRLDSMDHFLKQMGKEYQMNDLEQLRQDVQEVLDFMLEKKILAYSDPISGW